MRIYIAGPMFGKIALNEELFRKAAKTLNLIADDVVVPHDIDAFDHGEDPCPPGRHSEDSNHNDVCYLRTDIQEMLNCDTICLLPGWAQSVGARLELSIASQCGMHVIFYDETTDSCVNMN